MSFYGNDGFNAGGAQQQNSGGFFSPGANQTEGGVSSTPDFGGSQSKGNKKDRETLVPVTIQMIKQAQQDENDDAMFRFNGAEFNQVRVVGCIVEAKEQSTSLLYTVEDGTGRIEVKIWLDSDDTDELASTRAKCSEGVYIRIVGQVRTFQDRRNITAFNIRPIEDFNEVTHHALEAIYVNLRATKAGGSGAARQSTASATSSNNMGQGAGQQQQQFGGGGGSGMRTIDQDVLEVFKSATDSDQGLDIKQAIEQLIPKGYSAADIRKACGFLQDEGHLYSTIDENHLKSTE